MGLFDTSSKKSDPLGSIQMPALTTVPIEQVTSMKQQGMSDSIIIQTLQRDGYKTHQIFDAMNQAELVSGSPRNIGDLQQENMPGGPQIFVNPPSPAPPSIEQMDQSQEQMMPPMPQQQAYQPEPEPAFPSYPPQSPMPQGEIITLDQVEEIAESIIEEKWDELARGVGKIVEWKERTDARLNEMEASLNQLQQGFGELHQGVLGKLSDYDRNMGSVGTDIKAMQKVFQQMLPAFTENVNELSRLTRNMKTKGP